MIAEQATNTARSMYKRYQIALICQKHNWDTSKEKEITQECNDNGYYPHHYELINILSSRQIPSIQPSYHADLNYTLGQDKNTIKQENKHEPAYDLKINSGRSWTHLEVDMSKLKHVRNIDKDTEYGKPIIHKDNDGIIWVIITYTIDKTKLLAPVKLDENRVMGVDIGLVKAFSASIITDNGYTVELLPSRELDRLMLKLTKRQAQLNELKTAIKHYHDYMITQNISENAGTQQAEHYKLMLEHKKYLRKQIIRLKHHAAILTGRDLLWHAVNNNVSIVSMEDLRKYGNKSGKWAFSEQQTSITIAMMDAGITVHRVDPSMTSHTEPFTGSTVHPMRNRMVRLVDGTLMDRDRIASLNVALRENNQKTLTHTQLIITRARPHNFTRRHKK